MRGGVRPRPDFPDDLSQRDNLSTRDNLGTRDDLK